MALTIDIVGFWSLYSSVTVDTVLAGCVAVSWAVWFLMFWRNMLLSSSRVMKMLSFWRRRLYFPLKNQEPHSQSHSITSRVPEYTRLLSSWMWHRYHHFRATSCFHLHRWVCQSRTAVSISGTDWTVQFLDFRLSPWNDRGMNIVFWFWGFRTVCDVDVLMMFQKPLWVPSSMVMG
jgi:hypothetical protein